MTSSSSSLQVSSATPPSSGREERRVAQTVQRLAHRGLPRARDRRMPGPAPLRGRLVAQRPRQPRALLLQLVGLPRVPAGERAGRVRPGVQPLRRERVEVGPAHGRAPPQSLGERHVGVVVEVLEPHHRAPVLGQGVELFEDRLVPRAPEPRQLADLRQLPPPRELGTARKVAAEEVPRLHRVGQGRGPVRVLPGDRIEEPPAGREGRDRVVGVAHQEHEARVVSGGQLGDGVGQERARFERHRARREVLANDRVPVGQESLRIHLDPVPLAEHVERRRAAQALVRGGHLRLERGEPSEERGPAPPGPDAEADDAAGHGARRGPR